MSQPRSAAGVYRRLLACTAVLASTGAALTHTAHASCVARAPSVIWSYPARDETAVPLDADLLLVPEGIALDARITLDGEPLTAASEVPGHFDLGTLQAQTTYEVAIATIDPITRMPRELSWTFTTGDASAAEETKDELEILSASGRVVAHDDPLDCRSALYADTCFDTGEPTLESFETNVDAMLWAVETLLPKAPISHWRLYPGECGQPRALDYGWLRPDGYRYRVHAIQRDGTLASSDPIKAPLGDEDEPKPTSNRPEPDGGDGAAAASSDCAVARVGGGGGGGGGGGAGLAVWLVLALSATATRSRAPGRR